MDCIIIIIIITISESTAPLWYSSSIIRMLLCTILPCTCGKWSYVWQPLKHVVEFWSDACQSFSHWPTHFHHTTHTQNECLRTRNLQNVHLPLPLSSLMQSKNGNVTVYNTIILSTALYGYKTYSLRSCIEHRLWVSRNGCINRYETEQQNTGENCIIRSFMICVLHQTLCGWSSHAGWDGWGTRHTRGRTQTRIGFQWGNLTETTRRTEADMEG